MRSFCPRMSDFPSSESAIFVCDLDFFLFLSLLLSLLCIKMSMGAFTGSCNMLLNSSKQLTVTLEPIQLGCGVHFKYRIPTSEDEMNASLVTGEEIS